MLRGMIRRATRLLQSVYGRRSSAPEQPAPAFGMLLERERLRHRDFFFIQVGANDGIRHDPLHAFVQAHRCRGILIEPQHAMFEQLRETYRDHAQLTLLNLAIGDAPHKKFYRMQAAPPDAPSWWHGIASFDRETVAKHRRFYPDIERYIVEDEVRCLTLKQLVDEHRVTRLDLLQIDTEGYDFEIIKMIEPTGLRPSLIHFEHKHLSDANRMACIQHLEARGYRLLLDRVNTAAFLP